MSNNFEVTLAPPHHIPNKQPVWGGEPFTVRKAITAGNIAHITTPSLAVDKFPLEIYQNLTTYPVCIDSIRLNETDTNSPIPTLFLYEQPLNDQWYCIGSKVYNRNNQDHVLWLSENTLLDPYGINNRALAVRLNQPYDNYFNLPYVLYGHPFQKTGLKMLPDARLGIGWSVTFSQPFIVEIQGHVYKPLTNG